MTINKFEYVALTIIDIDAKKCCEYLNTILNRDSNSTHKKSIIPLDIDKFYTGSPIYNGFSKFMIWEPKTQPGKTVFFSNKIDGRQTLIYKLSNMLNLLTISIAFSNGRPNKDDNPAYIFNYYDFTKKIKIERTIYNIKEQYKWVFYQNGEVQPFEDMTNYDNKIKPKRFNNEIILDYLKKLNINIEDNQFWESKNGMGIFFEQLKW